MNVTLTIDDDLVRKIRKIAVDRDTSFAALVREYLQRVADEENHERRQSHLTQLERSFRELSAPLGPRDWSREELYERRHLPPVDERESR